MKICDPGCVSVCNDDAAGWTVRNSNFCRKKKVLFSKIPGLSPGPHPASYSNGTGSYFLGLKRSGLEVDHWPPSDAEIKNW